MLLPPGHPKNLHRELPLFLMISKQIILYNGDERFFILSFTIPARVMEVAST